MINSEIHTPDSRYIFMYPGQFIRRQPQPYAYVPQAPYPPHSPYPPQPPYLPTQIPSQPAPGASEKQKKTFTIVFVTAMIVIIFFFVTRAIFWSSSGSGSNSKVKSGSGEDFGTNRSDTGTSRWDSSYQRPVYGAERGFTRSRPYASTYETHEPEQPTPKPSVYSHEFSAEAESSPTPRNNEQVMIIVPKFDAEDDEASYLPEIKNDPKLAGVSSTDPSSYISSIKGIYYDMINYLNGNDSFESGSISRLAFKLEMFYKDLMNSNDTLIISRLLWLIEFERLDLSCLIMSLMQSNQGEQQFLGLLRRNITLLLLHRKKLVVYCKAKMNLLELKVRFSASANASKELVELYINKLLFAISLELQESKSLFSFTENLNKAYLNLSSFEFENFYKGVKEFEKKLDSRSTSIKYCVLDVLISDKSLEIFYKCLVFASLNESKDNVRKLYDIYINKLDLKFFITETREKLDSLKEKLEIPKAMALIENFGGSISAVSLVPIARLIEMAKDEAKVNEEFLAEFYDIHPLLHIYKILLNETSIVKAKVTNYLAEKFKDQELYFHVKKSLLSLREPFPQSLPSFYASHSNEIFPLFYYVNQLKDFSDFSEVEFDRIKQFLKVIWELKLLKAISQRDARLVSDDDKGFIKNLQFNPLLYETSLSNLEKFRGDLFSHLPELPESEFSKSLKLKSLTEIHSSS